MNKKNIRRSEIYLANLEPIIGSEQGGIRPVLIIQNIAPPIKYFQKLSGITSESGMEESGHL